MEAKHIVKTEIIKTRNWTESLIKKHLGEPDLLKTNPHYKSGSQMKLFLLERVIQVENSKEFQVDFEKSKRRRIAALNMIKTKTENLIHNINNIEIMVEKIDFYKLLKDTIDQYNSRNIFSWINEKTLDTKTKNRLMVNYIRHHLTSYESFLDTFNCQVGKLKAYKTLNRRIYDKISEVYPTLKMECSNQLNIKLQRM
jgi:ribosome-associated protein YbcJ (S4-like RNA binding protein)